jgi:hypothetical protein
MISNHFRRTFFKRATPGKAIMAKTKLNQKTGHKGVASQGNGKDGEAKKIQRANAEAFAKAAKAAQNAKKRILKKAAVKPKTFDESFSETLARQTAESVNLFSGPLGEYALCVDGKKMIVRSFKNEKGLQFESLGTNFGFVSKVFIGERLVKGYKVEIFNPNFNLPDYVQAEQKQLHTFLRTAYDGEVFEESKPSPSSLVSFSRPKNKFAGFAREERTCSDISLLVTGSVRVYRIADASGKYAVLSLSSVGNDIKVIYINLRYIEEGHEIEGQIELGTMCELHKLCKESLGIPFGENKEKMENQVKLHRWLRKTAMAAGLKDKSSQNRKAA